MQDQSRVPLYVLFEAAFAEGEVVANILAGQGADANAIPPEMLAKSRKWYQKRISKLRKLQISIDEFKGNCVTLVQIVSHNCISKD